VVQDNFGGVETSVYDHDNRLSTREISGISTTQMRADFTYRDDGSLDTVKRYSNVSATTKVGETDYLYDAAGRTTGINEYNGSGTALASYVYDYDPASNVTAAVIDGTPQDYTYDADNQLLADGTTTVTYDATGNRDNGGNTPGSANQLSSDGTWNYTYNDEGDLTKKSKGASAETWTYGYDNKNELTWAEDRATDGGTLLQRVEFKEGLGTVHTRLCLRWTCKTICPVAVSWARCLTNADGTSGTITTASLQDRRQALRADAARRRGVLSQRGDRVPHQVGRTPTDLPPPLSAPVQ
jgi:hypothetical protein